MPQPIRLKDHEKDARLVRRRVVVGAVLVLLLTCVLIARLYYLQVIQYEYHSTLSENNRVHVQPIPPTRGLIYDRNGLIIADNRPSFSLTVTRERAGDWEQTLDVIVEALQLTPDDRALFEKRMKQGRRPFEPVPILFELSEEQIARVAVNQFRLPGVEVVAQLVRHYPQGAHFAHSVGYVGRINEKELKELDPINYSGTHHIGKTGIERFYEDTLHGEVGYEEVETNARGRVLRVLKRTDPKPGKDLVLTIDTRLQEAAEAALGGRRGAIVAIEPSSGDVLAMVSQPSSGLEAGVVTPESRVFDPGFYQLPNYDHKYRNWNRTGDGWVSLETAIMRSNDTYFYDLAHKMGIDRLHASMSRFGFGQKVALDMFEETTGLMPSRDWKRARYRQAWYPGETLILGIGQGYMQATPLQLAQATALMASRGKWIRPHLAKTIEGKAPEDPNPMPDITLRDPKFWDYARSGMEQVMHGARGTARKVGDTSVYRIAGKSGTAQVVAIKQGEKYDRSKVQERHRDHALFIGFAPADNPKIAVAVMVENGESGSGVAAPVVKQVMDAWLLGPDGQLKPEFQSPQAPLTAEKSPSR